ncbi:MAG: SDR family NAD(P)-dependent oxidoreductase [Verrucomicrobia bacterium]|nr:SDR family NAD(P)-dependent oxidoreductase [Verrucomicrobiota bacterium]
MLASAKRNFNSNPNGKRWSTPEGAIFGQATATGKLGVVFPGQGAQYVGMMRDLACHYPQAQKVLDTANLAFDENKSEALTDRLSDYIYPHPGFDKGTAEKQAEQLKQTEVAQPAIGAACVGGLDVLRRFGLRADVFGGHSYGELVALYAGGRIDEKAFHDLSNFRGRLMAEASQAAEASGMLVAKTSIESVQELLQQQQIGVVIANHNAPEQIVLAGTLDAIGKVAAVLSERSIWNRILPVSAAFHSPLVADAVKPFTAALENAKIHPSTVPVFANSTADVYPESAAELRSLLAGQLAKPVRFVDQIQAMFESGVRTFVEVGPGNGLSGLVKAILRDKEATVISLDASKGRGDGVRDLALVLCEMSASGYSINLQLWDEEFSKSTDRNSNNDKSSKFNYPICGANQRTKKPPRPPSAPRPKIVEVALSATTTTTTTTTTSASAPASPSFQSSVQSERPIIPAPLESRATSAEFDAALRASREGLVALQKLQEQTADLHRKFLEGQDTALKTFLALAEHQRTVLGGATAVPAALAPTPVQTPAPAVPVAAAAPAPAAVVAAPVAVAVPVSTPLERAVVTTPAPQPAGTDQAKVAEVLMQIVAEKTGYPTEMLNLDMGLDADLGIDSIKRVEIMSALQTELPDAPEIKPEQLGSLQTLQEIVSFLSAHSVSISEPATASVAAAATGTGTGTGTGSRVSSKVVADTLLFVVSEKTGYPVEMLNLDMGLDSDLGIDSIKRVEIMSALQGRLPDAPEIKPDQLGSLQTLQQVADFLGASTSTLATAGAPSSTAATAANSVNSVVSSEQVAGVLLAVVSEKTGYPVEMLNLNMGLDSDLGIDSIKRVEIMSELQGRLPDAPEIKPDQLGSLETLQQVADFLGALPATMAGAVAAASTASTISKDEVAGLLLVIVSEKTGYPVEMLNLEMGLDSDLGIDSIKRVEIMSALQNEMSELPEIKPEDLGTFQTLQHIVQFLCEAGSGSPNVAGPAHDSRTAAASSVEHGTAVGEPEQALERLIVQSTEINGNGNGGYEKIVLEPGAIVWLVDDGTDLSKHIEKELGSLGYQVVRQSLDKLRKRELPDRLGALIIVPATGQKERDQVPDAFGLIQYAGTVLRRTGETADAVLATVSRLDGSFGLQGLNGNSNPSSGGLAGMTKTARHEWPEVHCKAIDLDAESSNANKAARAIVAEMFSRGPVEIGLSDDTRRIVELHSSPINGHATKLPLAQGDVVVVSGGGRGVTAQTAIALAKACKPTLIILGRSPEPEGEPDWLISLTETSAIKRAIHANLGNNPKLSEVESAYRRWMSNREVSANLQQMEQAGAVVRYHAIDIRDAAAVGSLFESLRKEFGPIRGLIHGAGVLADRKIEDKTSEQFQHVYSTKVDGLHALLQSAKNDDLKIIALFSSFTGRYGRTGQVAYAAANEVLNKFAQFESLQRPSCRVVSVNWGPWDGGMINSGLKTLFEKEGIGLIEPRAGANHLVRELSIGTGGPVEVVVVAPSPGLDGNNGNSGRMVGASPEVPASSFSDSESAIEMTVSVDRLPILRSHVLSGKAVVPAALMVEWMAHGAMHGHPGMVFNGLVDFSVLKGIILKEEETVSLSVKAMPPVKTESGVLVPVQLVSQQAAGSWRVHARAQVRLGYSVAKPDAPQISAGSFQPDGRNREEIYTPEFLFHGADLEGLLQITESDAHGIAATVSPAPKPSSWINEPLRQSWITEPMMLDCFFQMMILWSLQHQGAHSLPTSVGKFQQFVRRFPQEAITIRSRITSIKKHLVRANMECFDSKGNLLASLEGYECVLDSSLKTAFTHNRLGELLQT